MKQKCIEVRAYPDGSIRIEGVGFVGGDCEKATAFLEQALGVSLERRRKPEFHGAVVASRKQKVGL